MKRWRNNNRQSLLEGYDISEIANCNPLSSITLKSCGLDPEYNFLKAPICECGCGRKTNIVLYDNDDVLDFCAMMCDVNGCEYCGVFAITEDKSILIAIKTEDGIDCFEGDYSNPKYIGKLVKDIKLHCFGLIVFDGNDSYRVVES